MSNTWILRMKYRTGLYLCRIKHLHPKLTKIAFQHLVVFKCHSTSDSLILSSCYPIRQYFRRWMDRLILKKHLLPCTYCVILFSLASLRPFCFPPPIFHPWYLSLSPFSSLLNQVFARHFLLSVAVCPSCTSSWRWTVCLFIILHSYPHPQHTLQVPLSFWLSSSGILPLSSCLSLSIFSKNSSNLKFWYFFFPPVLFIYGAAVVIILMFLITALSTVHNLDWNSAITGELKSNTCSFCCRFLFISLFISAYCSTFTHPTHTH